jgi:hypothetical protein
MTSMTFRLFWQVSEEVYDMLIQQMLLNLTKKLFSYNLAGSIQDGYIFIGA